MRPLKMRIHVNADKGIAEVRDRYSNMLMKVWVENDGELCVRTYPNNMSIVPQASNHVTIRIVE